MSERLSIFPFGGADRDPKRFTITELCQLTGSKPRRIQYLKKIKAIDPSIGQTRSATYTWKHVEDVRAINTAMWQRGKTALEAAEFCHYDRPAAQGNRVKKSTAGSIENAGQQYQITNEISITTTDELSVAGRADLTWILAAALSAVKDRLELSQAANRKMEKKRRSKADGAE